jgi:hypothetical protein
MTATPDRSALIQEHVVDPVSVTGTRARSGAARTKGHDMKTTFPIESHTSPAPGIIPEPSLVHDQPASPRNRRGRRAGGAGTTRAVARHTPLARVLAALRGDKYMVDPPAKPPTAEG